MHDNKIKLTGIITWIICTLFFIYEFMLRTVLGTFQNQLTDDLHLTPVHFAILSSTCYQLIYGLMQIPAGIIIDNFGLKKTLLTCALVCTIANLGFSLTHDFITSIVFRMLMGLGASCGFLCVLVAIYDWMPRRNIALFIGISQFIGTMGPMFAAGPLSSLSFASGIGWRDFFSNLAMIGGALSILIFLYVDNNRREAPSLMWYGSETMHGSPPSRGRQMGVGRQRNERRQWSLIKKKQIWFIALYSAIVYFSIDYLTANEGISFLIKKGFPSTFSSYMITIAWLGYAISCPLLGYLSDKIQRRKPFMILSALITVLALTGIIYLPLNNALLAISFASLGIGASGSSLGFVIMAEQCNDDTLAVGLGLNNTMMVLSSALNAPIIAYVLSRVTIGSKLHLGNYYEAFAIMLILAIIGVLIVIFCIKETYCKAGGMNSAPNSIQKMQLIKNVEIIA